jgi:two-component system, NarL family, sensor histidine kinase DesK
VAGDTVVTAPESALGARNVRMAHDLLDMERKVARCRVLLSLMAIFTLAVYPAHPLMPPSARFGPLGLDPRVAIILLLHLIFSLAIWGFLARPLVASPRMVHLTTLNDVLFSAAVALFTEGAASPFYIFFSFAVVAAAVRGGFRFSMIVTAVCIWIYFSLIVTTGFRTAHMNTYIMRPVYLAIVGYLVAYLGRQRLALEAKLQNLERSRERGEIARALHDGCVQTLAGTNLTLESCRELVRRGQETEAITALQELQASITREYDSLRTYVRELAEREAEAPETLRGFETRFTVHADFAGSGVRVEHVLQILLEGVRNVRRHAFARSATVGAHAADGQLRITIADDGVGLPDGSTAPWSIASRVDQLGGQLRLTRPPGTGAHLAVVVPEV